MLNNNSITSLAYSNYYLLLLGCQEGNVRLVGGDFENEGTVEVCLDNLWGLIADQGWTDGDAKVVCSQLGYTDGSKHCTLLRTIQKNFNK